MLAALLATVADSARAQVVTYNLSRQKWLTQLGTNAMPLLYRFSAWTMGNGLKKAEARSPSAVFPLEGNSYQMDFATNFPAFILSETNLAGGLDEFNAVFPATNYSLYTESQISVLPIVRTYAVPLTNDFPLGNPVFTNITALSTLESTQTFAWAPCTTNPAAYTRFALLEGDITTNLIDQILNEGIASLTNTLKVLAWELRLSSTVSEIAVSNLNPVLDHLAYLEFRNPSPLPADLTVGSEAASAAVNLTFFFGLKIVSQPLSQTVSAGDMASFSVVAIGARPISYQWQFNGQDIPRATNAIYLLPVAAKTNAGEYRVIVSSPAGQETSAAATLTVTDLEPLQPLQLSEMQVTENGAFRFLISGDHWTRAALEASTDLVQWEQIGEVTTSLGAIYYTDFTAVNHPWRFYRAKTLE